MRRSNVAQVLRSFPYAFQTGLDTEGQQQACAMRCLNLGDYFYKLLMMINGGKYGDTQILSRKSIELMTKDNLGDVKFPYAGMGFGLGVQVIKNRASLSVLGSDGEYVGGGAYRTEFWVDPKEDITGIILVQLREPQYNLRFHDTIKTLIYQALR